MPTTKYKIAEQIVRILDGGDVPVASKVHIQEAKLAVEQVLNGILKMEYLKINIPMGEMIPNGASVATYDGIEVTAYQTTSKLTLPAIPLKLPRDIGVFEIYDPTDPDCLYIPMEMGQQALIKDQPLLSNLLGHVGYRRYGDTVVFTQDLTIPNETTTLSLRLVVLDISQYDDWSILPIPADMEAQCIEAVVNLFRGEPSKDKLVDSGRKEQTGVPVQQQSQP